MAQVHNLWWREGFPWMAQVTGFCFLLVLLKLEVRATCMALKTRSQSPQPPPPCMHTGATGSSVAPALIAATKEALWAGVAACGPGWPISDIGAAVQVRVAELAWGVPGVACAVMCMPCPAEHKAMAPVIFFFMPKTAPLTMTLWGPSPSLATSRHCQQHVHGSYSMAVWPLMASHSPSCAEGGGRAWHAHCQDVHGAWGGPRLPPAPPGPWVLSGSDPWGHVG